MTTKTGKLTEGSLIAGRYELHKEIGKGGMADIWLAIDLQLHRQVAIKRMQVGQRQRKGALDRFKREAMAIARLNSVNIVQIYDYVVDDDVPYIVLEFLEGEDLQTRLQRVRQMSLTGARAMISQLCAALSVAHAAGIVHRDLKPANVFIARNASTEVVKILDFGVVSLLDDALAGDEMSGMLVGTPRYMSPEQIRGTRVDHRSDLWALGVLTYEALVGAPPFSAQQINALLTDICMEAFPPATVGNPDLPTTVDAFFQRALAKEPVLRFESAQDFAAAFIAAISPQKNKAAKIIYVDDETDAPYMVKQGFRKQIRQSAYEFLFAANGEDALRLIHEQPDTDMVITDINMPVMDGLTLLSQIGDAYPGIKTVIVSAYGDMINIRTAMNRGAFDFVTKPIDFGDLTVTIDKTLRIVEQLRGNVKSRSENELLRQFVSPHLLATLDEVGADNAIGVFNARARRPGVVVCISIAGDIHDMSVRTVDANFDVIAGTVTAYGGDIEKFDGRAVVASFWGGDRLERAIQACCSLRTEFANLAQRTGQSSPFARGVSMGLVAGEMDVKVVGSRSADGRLDVALLGLLVEQAKQLAELAGAGRIWLPRRLCEGVVGQIETKFVALFDLPGEPNTEVVEVICGSINVNDSEATEIDDVLGVTTRL